MVLIPRPGFAVVSNPNVELRMTLSEVKKFCSGANPKAFESLEVWKGLLGEIQLKLPNNLDKRCLSKVRSQVSSNFENVKISKSPGTELSVSAWMKLGADADPTLAQVERVSGKPELTEAQAKLDQMKSEASNANGVQEKAALNQDAQQAEREDQSPNGEDEEQEGADEVADTPNRDVKDPVASDRPVRRERYTRDLVPKSSRTWGQGYKWAVDWLIVNEEISGTGLRSGVRSQNFGAGRVSLFVSDTDHLEGQLILPINADPEAPAQNLIRAEYFRDLLGQGGDPRSIGNYGVTASALAGIYYLSQTFSRSNLAIDMISVRDSVLLNQMLAPQIGGSILYKGKKRWYTRGLISLMPIPPLSGAGFTFSYWAGLESAICRYGFCFGLSLEKHIDRVKYSGASSTSVAELNFLNLRFGLDY